jgi:hypothetical protein
MSHEAALKFIQAIGQDEALNERFSAIYLIQQKPQRLPNQNWVINFTPRKN